MEFTTSNTLKYESNVVIEVSYQQAQWWNFPQRQTRPTAEIRRFILKKCEC